MGRKKATKEAQPITSVAEVVVDGKYISEIKETAQKLSELVKPLPVEAILLWIEAHTDDEETIDTVNRFTFLHTRKYRQGRY